MEYASAHRPSANTIQVATYFAGLLAVLQNPYVWHVEPYICVGSSASQTNCATYFELPEISA